MVFAVSLWCGRKVHQEGEGYEDFNLKRIEVPKGEEDLARFALVDLRSEAR
jgi:hypothetical protein